MINSKFKEYAFLKPLINLLIVSSELQNVILVSFFFYK